MENPETHPLLNSIVATLSLHTVDPELTHGKFRAQTLSEPPSQLSRAHTQRISSSSTVDPKLTHSLKLHRSYPELTHGGSQARPLSETPPQLPRAHPRRILSLSMDNPDITHSLNLLTHNGSRAHPRLR
uniref:Uncharacterized protein n=1 Tax=Brassica campestris TaxID=3711 RepID=M4FD08_BRACM